MATVQTRARASGQCKHDELVLVLQTYMTSPGRIPPYGKKLERNIIVEHRKLLIGLRNIQDNLSFPTAMVKKALLEVAESKMATWRFSKADCEQLACDVGARVRCMCRHLAQALGKTPPPKWVSQVLDKQDKDHLDKELDDLFQAMDKKNEGKEDAEEEAEEEAEGEQEEGEEEEGEEEEEQEEEEEKEEEAEEEETEGQVEAEPPAGCCEEEEENEEEAGSLKRPAAAVDSDFVKALKSNSKKRAGPEKTFFTVADWKAKEATTAAKLTSGETFWANADGSLQVRFKRDRQGLGAKIEGTIADRAKACSKEVKGDDGQREPMQGQAAPARALEEAIASGDVDVRSALGQKLAAFLEPKPKRKQTPSAAKELNTNDENEPKIMKKPSRAEALARADCCSEAIARAGSASSSGAKPSDPGDWMNPISLGDFAFSDESDDLGDA
jgi:hypothetical protein